MKIFFARRLALAFLSLLSTVALPATSYALDGYFLVGYGPRQKALGGAGAADGRDAMAASVNPATIVGLDRQFAAGITAVLAHRGYRTEGRPAIVAPGDIRSGRPWFPVPNLGYVQPIDADSAWSVVTFANGGISTAYDWGHFRAPLGGPLGGGFMGIDVSQVFTSVTYARRFATPIGPITIGFAPTIAVQMMNVQGVKTLAIYSSNPWEMSDMAYDWSYGGGIRMGLLWGITDRLRFGLSGATPMWMSRLEKYSGLLGDHGNFDVPANLQAGFAYDVLPNVTLLADWKHIFYSAVSSLGNPANPLTRRSLGGIGGPGFDFKDTDSASFGVEWRATPALALRAGYHYATSPIRERSVTTGILSPLVARHHVAAGFNYAITRNSSLDFAFLWDFKNSIRGPEFLPQMPGLPWGGPNPRANITLWGYGGNFTVGYNYKWDAGDNSWIPSHF